MDKKRYSRGQKLVDLVRNKNVCKENVENDQFNDGGILVEKKSVTKNRSVLKSRSVVKSKSMLNSRSVAKSTSVVKKLFTDDGSDQIQSVLSENDINIANANDVKQKDNDITDCEKEIQNLTEIRELHASDGTYSPTVTDQVEPIQCDESIQIPENITENDINLPDAAPDEGDTDCEEENQPLSKMRTLLASTATDQVEPIQCDESIQITENITENNINLPDAAPDEDDTDCEEENQPLSKMRTLLASNVTDQVEPIQCDESIQIPENITENNINLPDAAPDEDDTDCEEENRPLSKMRTLLASTITDQVEPIQCDESIQIPENITENDINLPDAAPDEGDTDCEEENQPLSKMRTLLASNVTDQVEPIQCDESIQIPENITENDINLPDAAPDEGDTDCEEENQPLSKMRTLLASNVTDQVEPIQCDESIQIPENITENDINLPDAAPDEGDTDCEEENQPLSKMRTLLASNVTDQVEPIQCDESIQIPENITENDINLPDAAPQEEDREEEQSSANKKSKKRKRNPEMWTKNVKKRLKNTGKTYKTVKGRTISAKKLKPPCTTKCRLKCSEKIDEEKRLSIFNNFWNIGDLGKQRYYVKNCMGVVKPKYSLHNEKSTRSLNVSYHFTIDSERIRVCKRFFSATLDIGHSFLSTVNKSNSTGVVSEDRRGHHGNTGRCLSNTAKDGVREHINSYPRKESHYCRATSSKQYLDGDLNLSLMYRQYKEWCRENNKPIVKQGSYEHIFRNDFNIAFHNPKKDQCSLCLSYQNASGDDKIQLKCAYDTHLKEKDLCRLEKKSDIASCENDDSKIICCYDMQAILQTPSGNDSLFFYKRRLNVYNCTVYDVLTKTAYCYLWNESLGGKGCDEVGTCIYLFLQQNCVGKHVIFYTDNCSAQNKNKYLLSLYHYAIKVLGVKSITHKYLVVGHTQNEGDNVHSVIEREKTRILKNGSIFIPSQWISLIQCAKKTGTPYVVHELDWTDILNLKELVKQFGKNFTVNNDGDRVVWNDIRKIYMQASSPYLVFYNDTYNSETSMKFFNVRHKIRGKNAENVYLQLQKKYHKRPKISSLKKRDLLSLCDAKVIPSVYRDYYESLEATDNIGENEENYESD